MLISREYVNTCTREIGSSNYDIYLHGTITLVTVNIINIILTVVK